MDGVLGILVTGRAGVLVGLAVFFGLFVALYLCLVIVALRMQRQEGRRVISRARHEVARIHAAEQLGPLRGAIQQFLQTIESADQTQLPPEDIRNAVRNAHTNLRVVLEAYGFDTWIAKLPDKPEFASWNGLLSVASADQAVIDAILARDVGAAGGSGVLGAGVDQVELALKGESEGLQ